MYKHINNQLSQIQHNIYRLQKIDSMLLTLNDELHILEEKLQLAGTALEKENRDYEKLKEKSISSILFSVLGTLDEKIEKEHLEALEAALKYNQCMINLKDVRNQISKFEIEKNQYKNAQTEYDKLYYEKLQLLMNDNSSTAKEIMRLNKDIELSTHNLQEIHEATNVGKKVQEGIANALESLNSAENWGTWDILGGGLIADIMKHSHIDKASIAAQNVHSLLRHFRTELTDVNISKEIQIDISNFATFADFFFDGLFADCFMLSKIKSSQESIHDIQSQVQSVLKELSKLEKHEQKTLDDLNKQIHKLILET